MSWANEWRFIVTDNSFVHLGELLNASEKKVYLPISAPATCSFRIRMDNPVAQYLENSQGYIKAYRGPNLMFYGRPVQIDENGDRGEQSLSVNAADQAWYFNHWLASEFPNGTQITGTIDRAQIALQFLNYIDFANGTELDLGIATASAGGTITNYVGQPLQVYADTLAELAAGVDGFEWRITPMDNYVAGGTPTYGIGTFFALPVFGTVAADAVFEYTDDGKGINNVESYTRVVNRDSQCNFVFVTDSGSQNLAATGWEAASDATSQTNWGLMESVVDVPINSTTLRQDLAQEHIRVRKNPRITYDMKMHIDPDEIGRIPRYGVDFELGDTVRVRVKAAGRLRFDIGLRVWAVTFEIDENGLERLNLTLSES